jgi:hypothetical protein
MGGVPEVVGGGVMTVGLGPAKGVDCGSGVACGEAAVCGDRVGVAGVDFCVAGGAVGCCARAKCPPARTIARPSTNFDKGPNGWYRPKRITQLKRFITICRLSSQLY